MASQIRYNTEKYPRSDSRKMIIGLRVTHPEWTLKQIGDKVGCSRERVRQILASEGMESRSTKAVYTRQPRHLKKGPPCKHCGTPVPYTFYSKSRSGRYPKYCSPICRVKYYHTDVTCSHCKKMFVLGKSQVKSRKERNKDLYCSHSCRSKVYWAIVKNERPNTFEYSTHQPMTQTSRKDSKNDDKTNSN